MSNGISFSYRYRDAGNYQACGSSDFTNLEGLSVETIKSTVTDIPERSITEFLNEVQASAELGWNVFHPIDRRSAIRATRLLS